MASKPARRALAKQTAKPPLLAKTAPKTRGRAKTTGGPPPIVVKVENNLIKIGTVLSRSKTVNRAARKGGAGGFFARMLRSGSKALTQGAVSGAKAAGLGKESTPEGAESWKRFQASHPGSVKGQTKPGATPAPESPQDEPATPTPEPSRDELFQAAQRSSGPPCDECGGTLGHHWNGCSKRSTK